MAKSLLVKKFFDCFKYCLKRSNFFKNNNHVKLYEKTAFANDFGPRDVPQHKMHESAGFLVWELPKVKNNF